MVVKLYILHTTFLKLSTIKLWYQCHRHSQTRCTGPEIWHSFSDLWKEFMEKPHQDVKGTTGPISVYQFLHKKDL